MVPEGYQPSKAVVIISSIFLGTLLVYFIYLQTKRYVAFSGEVRYTIAITTKRYMTSSGRDVDYTYRVNDVTHEGVATYAYESKVPNGKYWIKYSVKYPEISEIYQNMPIPACIDTLPPNGFNSRYNCQQFVKWKEWAMQQKKNKIKGAKL